MANGPTFYFNGVAFSEFAAWWNLVEISPEGCSFEAEVGIRDVYLIACAIDHEGRIESADADVFVYAAQEMLCRLLEAPEKAIQRAAEKGAPQSACEELRDSLMQTRQLALEHSCAFWTSSYSSEIEGILIERMRRSKLIRELPGYEPPPHIIERRKVVESLQEHQLTRLRRIAQSGGLDKRTRSTLLSMR